MTLVELMVVVAIIAIIAAVAITVFQDIQKKAKLAADQGNVAAAAVGRRHLLRQEQRHLPGPRRVLRALVTPSPPVVAVRAAPTYDTGNGKVTYTATVSRLPANVEQRERREDAQDEPRSRSRWSCRSSTRSTAWVSSTAS